MARPYGWGRGGPLSGVANGSVGDHDTVEVSVDVNVNGDGDVNEEVA